MLDQLLRLSNVNSTEIQKARDLILALYINMTCYKIPSLGKKKYFENCIVGNQSKSSKKITLIYFICSSNSFLSL